MARQTLRGARPNRETSSGRPVRCALAAGYGLRGALVEFVKGDAVVRQATPESLRADRATVIIPARVLEALGDYSLRVVNPGQVASTPYRPNGSEAVAGSNDE